MRVETGSLKLHAVLHWLLHEYTNPDNRTVVLKRNSKMSSDCHWQWEYVASSLASPVWLMSQREKSKTATANGTPNRIVRKRQSVGRLCEKEFIHCASQVKHTCAILWPTSTFICQDTHTQRRLITCTYQFLSLSRLEAEIVQKGISTSSVEGTIFGLHFESTLLKLTRQTVLISPSGK